jgi:hypothetical protein
VPRSPSIHPAERQRLCDRSSLRVRTLFGPESVSASLCLPCGAVGPPITDPRLKWPHLQRVRRAGGSAPQRRYRPPRPASRERLPAPAAGNPPAQRQPSKALLGRPPLLGLAVPVLALAGARPPSSFNAKTVITWHRDARRRLLDVEEPSATHAGGQWRPISIKAVDTALPERPYNCNSRPIKRRSLQNREQLGRDRLCDVTYPGGR